MKEKALKIIRHYGMNHQLKYFQSEIFELNEAIINVENYTGYVEHISDEIANVLVMLKQFQVYYGISDDDLKGIMEYKIERQLKRIEDENNGF